jgi:predicted acyl esterase
MKYWHAPQVAVVVTSYPITKQLALAAVLLLAPFTAGAVPADALADAAKVEWQWGVKIPLRDGVRLNATLYKPAGRKDPRPCLFTLTPYIGQSYHDRGMYFAAHGYSIGFEKNYNSGGVIADETIADSRPVTVSLFHDAKRRSVLYVPVALPETPGAAR